MDRHTAVLAYKTGIITLGEAMTILAPEDVHPDVKSIYLREAYTKLTGQSPDIDRGPNQLGHTLAFIQACGARREWISKQLSLRIKQASSP